MVEAGLPYSQLSKHAGIYLIRLIDKIAAGEPLQLVNGETVTINQEVAAELSNAAFNSPTTPDISDVEVDGTNKLTPTDDIILKKLLLKLATMDGNTLPSGDILKSAGIKGSGKGFNTGNVAEGILGAAVTAVFKKRKQGGVTQDDIIKILKDLSKPTVLSKNAVSGFLDTNSEEDKLHFKLGLGRTDYQALIKMIKSGKIHPEVQGLLGSALQFVNTSSNIAQVLRYIISDKKSNNIVVNSDGVSNNAGTKADLFIEVDGTPINLLSLKSSNVTQFGQASGHKVKNMTNFFKGTLGVMIPAKTIKLFTDEQSMEEVKMHVVAPVYASITKQIQKELSTDLGQAVFVDRLYDGIFLHATNRDDKVNIVILKNTPKALGFTELSFGPGLLETMKQYDFEVVNEPSNYIKVYGIPKGPDAKKYTRTSKEMLVQLRSQSMGPTLRNVIEMGPLLKQISQTKHDIEED